MARKRIGWRRRPGATLASAFALTSYLVIGGALPAYAGTPGCDNTGGTLTITLEDGDNATLSLVAGDIHVSGVSEGMATTCSAADFDVDKGGAAEITTLDVVTASSPGTGDEGVTIYDVANSGWPTTFTVALGGDTSGDTIVLWGSTGPDSITPTTIDTVSGEESFQVLGLDGADTINFSGYAGLADVSLDGGDGNDVLTGTAGPDLIYGGKGSDQVSAGNGNDIVYGGSDETGDGGDFIDGGAGDDNLQGGNGGESKPSGNDTIYGRAGLDDIDGGDGDDLIEGGVGADALEGGSGDDTVSYRGSSRGVTVVMTNTTQSPSQNSDAKSDVLTGFENLSGSMKSDILTGDTSANYIYGLNGDDQINGGLGDDFLFGGAGVDFLYGEGGTDTCEGYAPTPSKKNKDQYFGCEPSLSP